MRRAHSVVLLLMLASLFTWSHEAAATTTPKITWTKPAAIPKGTALSKTQLDASASVAGNFVYTPAAGTVLSPGTHTLSVTFTPTNTAAYSTATASVSLIVEATSVPVSITTTECPDGKQGTAYAGCTITATGGTPPYTFGYNTSLTYPTLPEGTGINTTTGVISGGNVGGQGVYAPLLIVTDADGEVGQKQISFAVSGNNGFLAQIFPSTSIFHHRVDAATTKLPVDTSPAAPMYSGYLPETVKPFFGNTSGYPFPNGIPAFEVPWNQYIRAVSTTVSVVFHVRPDSSDRSHRGHAPLERGPARLDLSRGGRRAESRALQNVAGDFPEPWVDRFVECALAQRECQYADGAGQGHLRCGGASCGAAAGECR